jgi:hypothetical protein
MASTDVKTKDTTAVGQVLDFAADSGMGLEGADKASFAIPFITCLQGLSPQCQPVKDGGVEGASVGKFINTITNELYTEVIVVPCAFSRRFLRWAPRSSGGGYKGEYNPIDVETNNVPGLSLVDGTYMMDVPAGSKARDDKGAPLFDHLADTRNHFCLVKTASGNWVQALISLGSSQIKKSKRWLSRMQGIELRNAAGQIYNPPSFSHMYKITSKKEENSKGVWYGLEIDIVGPIDDANVYAAAKKFNQAVNSGAVEVAPPAPAEEAASDKF